jgi:hypothetical protein
MIVIIGPGGKHLAVRQFSLGLAAQHQPASRCPLPGADPRPPRAVSASRHRYPPRRRASDHRPARRCRRDTTGSPPPQIEGSAPEPSPPGSLVRGRSVAALDPVVLVLIASSRALPCRLVRCDRPTHERRQLLGGQFHRLSRIGAVGVGSPQAGCGRTGLDSRSRGLGGVRCGRLRARAHMGREWSRVSPLLSAPVRSQLNVNLVH